jgi:aryl-phospho-beta-D-glucosidase BglC (GH1 family)
VLQFLTDTLIDVPNVVGIQLLNEPVNVPELWDFYNTALNSLRGSSTKAQKFPFYFHDAFDVDRGVEFMKNRGNEWNVLDYHSCKSRYSFAYYAIHVKFSDMSLQTLCLLPKTLRKVLWPISPT